MSLSFDLAYKQTVESKDHEGGYVLSEIEGDRGGQTFAGIARNIHPEWLGWKLIDAGEDLQAPRLVELVKQFYLVTFWNPISGENLPPRLAQQCFDFAVNAGVSRAAKALQRSLGISDDGSIGPKTVGAARMADQLKLLAKFNAQRLRHYAKQPTIYPGWLNRVALQLEMGAQ